MDRPATLRSDVLRPCLFWLLIGAVTCLHIACDSAGPEAPSDADAPTSENSIVDEIPSFSTGDSLSVPGPAAAVALAQPRTATATIPVADGWTLLSVPLDNTAALGTAFPSCSSAFVYDPGQGYDAVPDEESLPPGRGAFLNCTADTASVSGPVPDPSISLSEGWNLIGPHAQAVPTGDLSTDPGGLLETSFYGFTPGGGYAAADTLRPGHGYWVKAGGAGTLLLPGDHSITYTIQGSVSSSDGDDVSGNDIDILNPSDNVVASTTANNASYSVDVTNDELNGNTATIETDPAGYDPYSKDKTLSDGTNTHDITLQEILRDYAFTINDDQGNPVDNASIDIDETTSGDRDITTLTTDGSGDASTTLSVDEQVIGGDDLTFTVTKSGYQDLTFSDEVDNESESFTKNLTPVDDTDRITITFNPKTVGNSLYGGGYSGELNYTVSTPDTNFTATGSTTADVPIGDGDDLTVTHSDSEYISTFAVNNTDTEQPPFQVSGFPAEPDYQGDGSVTISKSDLVNQYQIRAIPSTSPEGANVANEYKPHLSNPIWTTRQRYNDIKAIIVTKRLDNQNDLSQDQINQTETAWNDATNQYPFLPINTVNKSFSDTEQIISNRGANYNYTGVETGSATNTINVSGGYAEDANSRYQDNETTTRMKKEIWESFIEGDDVEDAPIFESGSFTADAEAFARFVYSTY